MMGSSSLVCGIAMIATLASSPAWAITVPSPFVVENAVPSTGFNQPTGLAFSPDGRVFVAEKRGVVRVVQKGVKLTQPLWNGEAEVLNNGDRGLLGIAIDPHFGTNHYVYLLYTVDPDSNGVDDNDDAFGMLTRYRTSLGDSNTLDPSTRTVLLGATWRTGFPSGSPSHAIGGLRWGADGSLLVSAGEGAQYAQVDTGGRDPGLFGPTRTDPQEDIGAFRAQSLESLAGKILRINPASGAGYMSNPYRDTSLTSNRSRVWAYGFRNPFRFCVRPASGVGDTALAAPGTLSIGDVGWNSFEEIDTAPHGGMNFGWPCYEGIPTQPLYERTSPASHGCATFGTQENPAWPAPPTLTWNGTDTSLSVPRGYTGRCVIGGVFYSGYQYPSEYRGRLFFADFDESWIKVATFDAADHLLDLTTFATDAEGPVDFATDPSTGDVYFLALCTGILYHIRYPGTLDVPRATHEFQLSHPRPNPTTGSVVMTLDLPRVAEVGFAILDPQGRLVWSDPTHLAGVGRWSLEWRGVDRSGRRAPPGLYLARVGVGHSVIVRRITLLR